MVSKTQGLSPVTGREFNHGTRRTHGNERLFFPCFPCVTWFNKPRDCPELPAKNPTTEHAEHTEIRAPSFSVCSVYSVVSKTQGLSPVTSREFNHRTRRTHGNQCLLFPWFLWFPWLAKPRDCPELPAENPTTEHAEHTETSAFFFRGFCVFRG